MEILAMLLRSVISYTVFLTSRNIVKKSIGFADEMKHSLKLHRCMNCWRLYSGVIETCTFCGEETTALYNLDRNSNKNILLEERQDLEKQVYNGTKNFKFEPLKAPRIEVKYDRSSARTG